MLYRNISDG